MRGKLLLIGLAVAASISLVSLSAMPVGAQYPPTSTTTVQLAGSTTSTTTGGTVSIAATVQDSGTPVSGVQCAFAIGSQPGSDAELATAQATTNSQGVATTTLHVGSTAGTVDVTATCNGVTQHFGVVLGASTQPSRGAAALPNSGSGSDVGGNGEFAWIALGLALVGAGALASVGVRARR